MQERINTPWGTAKPNNEGYYIIVSERKGYYGKYLHRLIFESFYKINNFPKGYVIHHKDGNKQNNCILNLQLMRNTDHLSLHHKGKTISEEHKQRIRKANKGKQRNLGFKHSEESKQKMSIAKKGNKNRLGKYHSEESKRKMSESHKGQQVRAKYTLWDISKAVYDKLTMYNGNKKGLRPKRCFRIAYDKYRLPVGGQYDFVTCEIVSDLIKEECG